MAKITEKDVVNYLIANWERLFNREDMYVDGKPFFHHSKEYRVTPLWRCDMLNYIEMPHPKDESLIFKSPVYTEVKYNHNGRDLVYELQKGLNFVNRNCYKDFPRSIAVIADDTLDATTLRYIKDNNILFYQYDFDSFDLDTLTIRKVDIEELPV